MTTAKTTGQLRSLLLSTMEQVASGKMNYDRACAVIKGAAQVNESIYAELKFKSLARLLNETQHPVGSMPIVE